jgi:phosphoenolpyruvate synthase/pyruvate phosphate dikinase
MVHPTLIYAGDDPAHHSCDAVGGKGYNLLGLYNLAQQTGHFIVPNFFILTASGTTHYVLDYTYELTDEVNQELSRALDTMAKPVIARSSSSLEDGIKASFAGLFKSIPDVYEYTQAMDAAFQIICSAFEERVERHADRLDIDFPGDMAVIF